MGETTWDDIRLRGESIQAHGKDWPIYVFTGFLVKVRNTTGLFADAKGREKRIALSHERIPNDELRKILAPTDVLSMAYFSEDGGADGPYFLLYAPGIRRDYRFSEAALSDLWYRRAKGGFSPIASWRTHKLTNGFEGTPQFGRVLEATKAAGDRAAANSGKGRLNAFFRSKVDEVFNPSLSQWDDRTFNVRVYAAWLKAEAGGDERDLRKEFQSAIAGADFSDDDRRQISFRLDNLI